MNEQEQFEHGGLIYKLTVWAAVLEASAETVGERADLIHGSAGIHNCGSAISWMA